MPQSTLASEARVATETPQRYLAQLVKHFAHKRPTTLAEDNASGRIDFDAGPCLLQASPDLLLMRVEAATAEELARLQDVVARHLLRFAFRSPPEIVWS
jgi:hypothetical protein